MSARANQLSVEWLGRIPYAEALELQASAVESRRRSEGGDRLLLLEHPPVITLGRSTREQNLLESREALAARGIEVHEIARGGDVTYHGPGQLVGYLVMDLKARGEADLHRFVRRMESALIDALAAQGIRGKRIEGKTGVFVDGVDAALGPERKLASIGVGVKRWITYHGFALNVSTDLRDFAPIVPCGLDGVEMTSVARELGVGPLGLDAKVRKEVGEAFLRAWR
jgi:lipoate-protein ligase B